jgi:NAD-dependent deacetylase
MGGERRTVQAEGRYRARHSCGVGRPVAEPLAILAASILAASAMDISDRLIASLRSARHLMVFTGAGVSAESGLATFRTPQTGLWERFKPETLATPQAFQRDPALVWGWYEWRRMQVMRATPNPAHLAIKGLAQWLPRLTLVTQNVDDLHERAGSHPVIHLHGTLMQPRCERCGQLHVLPREIPDQPEDGRRVPPPVCVRCGGNIRPGVVWFGEALPRREWEDAWQAAGSCDTFLCIGTSSVVQPAASLIDRAIEARAVTIQINPNPTGIEDRLSHVLYGPAGSLLPEIVRQVQRA